MARINIFRIPNKGFKNGFARLAEAEATAVFNQVAVTRCSLAVKAASGTNPYGGPPRMDRGSTPTTLL